MALAPGLEDFSPQGIARTQAHKIFGADFPGQSKPSRTQPKSIADYTLSSVVVVPDCSMFRKVFCLPSDQRLESDRHEKIGLLLTNHFTVMSQWRWRGRAS
jgi:hypothetical protein